MRFKLSNIRSLGLQDIRKKVTLKEVDITKCRVYLHTPIYPSFTHTHTHTHTYIHGDEPTILEMGVFIHSFIYSHTIGAGLRHGCLVAGKSRAADPAAHPAAS